MGELVVAGETRVVITRGADGAAVLGGAGASQVAVITQRGAAAIARRLAAGMPAPVTEIEVPDGDDAKSFAVVESVVGDLVRSGLDRDGLVIGVGGGAVTDLAGFVASIYLRGVRVHLVPTTLLGAVDAAIGGKTGINAGAKNLVGTFRHPSRVVIDLDILECLPAHLIREGTAEALKAGLVGDPTLVGLYEARGLDAPLDEVVARAVAVKAAVVGRDPTEQGERAILNYGHTLGHGIEVAGARTHGEAVAVGMVAAGRASALLLGFGEEARQRHLIGALGLPVTAPDLDPATVLFLIARDKKRTAGNLRMVLLARIGEPQVVSVDATTVRAALAAVGIGGDTP